MEYHQIVAAVTDAIGNHADAVKSVGLVGAFAATDFRQIAQMVHNAFHTELDAATWRECPVASCQRARDAITALGQQP